MAETDKMAENIKKSIQQSLAANDAGDFAKAAAAGTLFTQQKLRNKILPLPAGQQSCILAGKPTADPKRYICLFRTLDDKKQDSLWNFEFLEEGKAKMWPYNGADSEDLRMELLEDHLEHAFENIE